MHRCCNFPKCWHINFKMCKDCTLIRAQVCFTLPLMKASKPQHTCYLLSQSPKLVFPVQPFLYSLSINTVKHIYVHKSPLPEKYSYECFLHCCTTKFCHIMMCIYTNLATWHCEFMTKFYFVFNIAFVFATSLSLHNCNFLSLLALFKKTFFNDDSTHLSAFKWPLYYCYMLYVLKGPWTTPWGLGEKT